jgi:hypothetical protein
MAAKKKVAKKTAAKLPKTLGALIDRAYALRQERLKLQTEVDDLKSQERAIEDMILGSFPRDDLERASGKLATATRTSVTVPSVQDWEKLYTFIKKNNAFELLQRRPHVKAFQDRWENDEFVPGVERFTKVGLSITKR